MMKLSSSTLAASWGVLISLTLSGVSSLTLVSRSPCRSSVACRPFVVLRRNGFPLPMSTAAGGGSIQDGTITTSSSSSSSSPSMSNGPELPPVPPMTKRLFLVRHGEVINPGGDRTVYYGAMDVPLSPLGEKEALAAAQYLQQFDLERVVSSPLSRAVFGAQAVRNLQHGGCDRTYNSNNSNNNEMDAIVIKEGFTELDRGIWCGQTITEIGPELMARFDACDESVTPDGGESYPFLKKRVLQARDEVLDMISVGRAAAIVSHLQVTRSLLSEALQIPTPEMSKLKIDTASITCIDYDVSANAAGTATQRVQFQSFKPNVGLTKSADGAN